MAVEIRIGDALEQLREMPAESVHCCVTSPPYWGLRDYGVDGQIGLEETPDEWCARLVEVFREVKRVLRKDATLWLNCGSSYVSNGTRASQSRPSERALACGNDGKEPEDFQEIGSSCRGHDDGRQGGSSTHRDHKSDIARSAGKVASPPAPTIHDNAHQDCALTGADSFQSDAQASTTLSSVPNDQAASALLDEAEAPSQSRPSLPDAQASAHKVANRRDRFSKSSPSAGRIRGKASSGAACGDPDCDGCGICWSYLAIPSLSLKTKDLMMQANLLALALQADGWYLRDDIIWNKPNPMPESVRDRCTNAYEHVFLLARDKRYFFDADAIKEQAADSVLSRSKYMTGGTKIALNGDRQDGDKGQRTSFADYQNGRNSRNVWTIATEAFSEAHFATFPTELARRCILAGTSSKGVCAECGAPWERVVEKEYGEDRTNTKHIAGGDSAIGQGWEGYQRRANVSTKTTGWQPTCKCDADLAQATVLDPFGGAGTTALVADRLQRNSVLIELNADYAAMARRRINNDRGDLLDIIEQPKPEQGSLCLVP